MAQVDIVAVTAGASGAGQGAFEHAPVHPQRVHAPVAAGRSGAGMQVTPTDDGPLTFWLQLRPGARGRITALAAVAGAA